MNWWWDTLWIELALLSAILCSQVFGQENYGGDAYYGGGNYGDYNGAGYYQVENYETKDTYNGNIDFYQPQAEEKPYITCYTCHYHVRSGDPEGMPGCDEPFDEAGIETVKCYDNAPCGQYSNPNKAKTEDNKPKTILCYTCHYHIQSGYPQGTPGCDDPFDQGAVIPTVNCPGPCGKLRQTMTTMTNGNPDDYLITRNCIPKCKERSHDENGNYQECCTTSLCNGAGSSRTVSSVTLIMSSFFSIFLLLR